MIVEYMLLFLISVMIILSPFMRQKGPITMMGRSGPVLGMKVEQALETGRGFSSNRNGQALSWKRR